MSRAMKVMPREAFTAGKFVAMRDHARRGDLVVVTYSEHERREVVMEKDCIPEDAEDMIVVETPIDVVFFTEQQFKDVFKPVE